MLRQERPRVAIICLNWNSYWDTIVCMDSLLGLDYSDYSIIVVDNGSTNGSADHIWRHMTEQHPDVPSGQYGAGVHGAPSFGEISRLALFRLRKNRGYAGGCNRALQFAMKDEKFTHFWILNNDTEVEPNALSAVLSRMTRDETIGICGFKLMHFGERDSLQAAGGGEFLFDRATSRAFMRDAEDIEAIESRLDFVHGASMICSRSFIEKVGLIEERYFLYFEEIDWAIRAARAGFRLGYAPDAVVYHKEGAIIGSSTKLRPSDRSLRYMARNRLIFTRLSRPEKYWTVVRRLCFEMAVHLKRLDIRAAWITLRAVTNDILFRPMKTRVLD